MPVESQTKQWKNEALYSLSEQQGRFFLLQMHNRHIPIIIHIISPPTPAPIYFANGGISKPDVEPVIFSEVEPVIFSEVGVAEKTVILLVIVAKVLIVLEE